LFFSLMSWLMKSHIVRGEQIPWYKKVLFYCSIDPVHIQYTDKPKRRCKDQLLSSLKLITLCIHHKMACYMMLHTYIGPFHPLWKVVHLLNSGGFQFLGSC
jgi:hypothetical protein